MPGGSQEKAFDNLLRVPPGSTPQGARVKTVATGAIRFLSAFCPLVSRALGCAPQSLTMGMPLPSTAATRIDRTAVAAERCW
jgi:hypothetical protein